MDPDSSIYLPLPVVVSDAPGTPRRKFVTPHSISEPGIDDGNLIVHSLRGDREASNVLLSRYRQLLYRLAYRVLRNHEDSEDAVQNCLLLAFSKLPGFKHEGAFRGWLVRILFNEAVSILRKRRHQSTNSPEPIPFEPPVAIPDSLHAPGPDPERALAEKQSAIALVRKVSELCPLQLSALVLCGIWQYTTEEASAILRVSPNTVRTRLFRARKRLAVAMCLDESIDSVLRTC
jgi:RNA polymerase sigma-70 factor (ECF subfamily)